MYIYLCKLVLILFSIYITGLIFKWIIKNGGINYFHELNTKKSQLLYEAIANSKDFYKAVINKDSQSRVNVPFRVGGPDGDTAVEKRFVEEAQKNGLHGLSGHRLVLTMLFLVYTNLTSNYQSLIKTFFCKAYL